MDSTKTDDKNNNHSSSIYHEDAISAAYRKEKILALRISKLSSRLTMISIVFPCIMIALFAFFYMDSQRKKMKSIKIEKEQSAQLFQHIEEKIKSIDLLIGKNQVSLEVKLAEMENQIAEAIIAKDNNKKILAAIKKLEKLIANNKVQNKKTINNIARVNKQIFADIKNNKDTTQSINNEVELFQKELEVLYDYKQKTDNIKKDLSVLKKQYKVLELTAADRSIIDEKIENLKIDITRVEKKAETVDKRLDSNMLRIQNDLNLIMDSTMFNNENSSSSNQSYIDTIIEDQVLAE